LVTGHFPNPKIAARKLLDIVRTSITDSGLPHAYTGARGDNTRSQRIDLVCLNPYSVRWRVLRMARPGWTPSIVPKGDDHADAACMIHG
jgi:hypothetical protein